MRQLGAFCVFLAAFSTVLLLAAGESTDAPSASRDRLAETRDWLERFSQQLRKAFGQYSRVDGVRQTLLNAVEDDSAENETARSQRFLRDAQTVAQRLNEFFAAKIAAIRALAESAETSAMAYDNETPHDLRSAKREELCAWLRAELDASTLRDDAPLETDSPAPPASVHVALNEYNCGAEVLSDFGWTGSGRLTAALRANAARDPTVTRQYVAGYSGLTRIFPGFKWSALPRDYTVDLFDSRHRPWFTGAESAPRDVLFLIDYSGSMRGVTLHVTKTLVQHILATLGQNDFFSGVWYNSRRDLVLADCLPRRHGGAGARFLPATTRNKQLFQRYLDRVEDRDQATLPAALNLSFTQFLQNSRSDASGGAWERERRTSGGHKLIVLFSDGVEIWPTDVVRQFQADHPDDKIRVFCYSMGRGRGRLPVLDWLTCATGGGGLLSGAGGVGEPPPTVSTVAEVRPGARLYLRKLSELLALAYRNRTVVDRPISWTTPYMDAQRGGAVLSASIPILDRQPAASAADASGGRPTQGFRAIAGLDVPLAAVGSLLGAFAVPHLASAETNAEANGGPTTYGFLVDNNGIVHYHPRQRLPKTETYAIRRTACHRIHGKAHRNSNTRLQYGRADEHVRRVMGQLDSIPTLDMLDLEYHPGTVFRKFREKIIASECDEEHGHLLKDETQKREYRCYHIVGTPFTVGFVRAEQLTAPQPSASHPLHRVGKSEDGGKTASGEPDPVDSLGYWLHDVSSVIRACESEAAIELDLVDRPARWAVWRRLTTAGRCRAVPLNAKHDDFHDGKAVATNAVSLLNGANALLSRWRADWPAAILSVRRGAANTSANEPVTVSHRHRRHGRPALTNRKVRAAVPAVPTISCALDGARYPLPREFDVRYFISAFVDFPAAALSAFYPKCRAGNMSALLDVYVPHGSLAALPKLERVKLRVDVTRPAAAIGDGTPTDMSSPVTLVVAEKLHRTGDTARVDALATVGAQFAANFLQDKFQRSLAAKPAAGGKSWPECQVANRRCYLLTTSAYVVASTAAGFPAPVHLSVLEPQIFEHLIKGDVIQKTTWTDYQADCAVTSSGGADPLSVRKQLEFQRQLLDSFFSGGEDSAEANEEEEVNNRTTAAASAGDGGSTPGGWSTASAASVCVRRSPQFGSMFKLASHLPALWYDVFTWMESIFGLFAGLVDASEDIIVVPAADEDEELAEEEEEIHVPTCNFASSADASTAQARERCVVEHTSYTLRARQTLSVKSVHYRIGCNSDLIIVPSTGVQLHLLILDEKCDNFPSIPIAHRYLPHRTECGLTNTRSRRLRADLDYSRTHPDESQPECPSAAGRPYPTVLWTVLLIFIISSKFLLIEFNSIWLR